MLNNDDKPKPKVLYRAPSWATRLETMTVLHEGPKQVKVKCDGGGHWTFQKAEFVAKGIGETPAAAWQAYIANRRFKIDTLQAQIRSLTSEIAFAEQKIAALAEGGDPC